MKHHLRCCISLSHTIHSLEFLHTDFFIKNVLILNRLFCCYSAVVMFFAFNSTMFFHFFHLFAIHLVILIFFSCVKSLLFFFSLSNAITTKNYVMKNANAMNSFCCSNFRCILHRCLMISRSAASVSSNLFCNRIGCPTNVF